MRRIYVGIVMQTSDFWGRQIFCRKRHNDSVVINFFITD